MPQNENVASSFNTVLNIHVCCVILKFYPGYLDCYRLSKEFKSLRRVLVNTDPEIMHTSFLNGVHESCDSDARNIRRTTDAKNGKPSATSSMTFNLPSVNMPHTSELEAHTGEHDSWGDRLTSQ